MTQTIRERRGQIAVTVASRHIWSLALARLLAAYCWLYSRPICLPTNRSVLSWSGNFLFNQLRFWQFPFLTIIFELSSPFQVLFVCRECLGLHVLIVLAFLSFRFSRTVLQGSNRQNPFHGQASPVGVWSFLSSSSTRRTVKKIRFFGDWILIALATGF